MLQKAKYRIVGLLSVLSALIAIGTYTFVGAEDPDQQVRVRIAAEINEDGSTSLTFHQFVNGAWEPTDISNWNATVPSLGILRPTWLSETFGLTVTVPAPEFGLPPSELSPPKCRQTGKNPTRGAEPYGASNTCMTPPMNSPTL